METGATDLPRHCSTLPVFGAIYYVLIAAVTFLVSKLHSDTIGNFALLFLVLSVSSAAAFYYILILYKKKLT